MSADRVGAVASTLVRGLFGLAMLAYPALVFFGVKRWGPRGAALVLLAVMAPVAIARLVKHRDADEVRTLALIPLVSVALIGLSAVLDRTGFVLVVPVAVNALLLLTFGSTLWTERPMIERFARLQDPELTPAQIAWCRLWTKLWCGFFVANGAVAGVLAARSDLDAWALYNGGIAYALIGVMFAVEWSLRRLRFGASGRAV